MAANFAVGEKFATLDSRTVEWQNARLSENEVSHSYWLRIRKEDRCASVATTKPRLSANSICLIVQSISALYAPIQIRLLFENLV